MAYIFLIIGFVLLIKGADVFVEGSAAIATNFGVPSLIIGMTIVAMGTSAPETAVSLSAALKGQNAIAISNVIGSNFFNLFMVIGVCAIIRPMLIPKDVLTRDYPINLGSWTLEPTSELNLLSSIQKGSENKKEYSLNIKSQSNYSAEAGVGLWLSKEMELPKDSRLKFTVGAMAYHDFADPYKLKVGMTGMDGFFTLRDDDHSQNHQLIKAAFEYDKNDFALYGAFTSYIDNDIRSVIKSGVKGEF